MRAGNHTLHLTMEGGCPWPWHPGLMPGSLVAAEAAALGGVLPGPLPVLPPAGQRQRRLGRVHRLLHGRVLRNLISQRRPRREPARCAQRAQETDTERAGWGRLHGELVAHLVHIPWPRACCRRCWILKALVTQKTSVAHRDGRSRSIAHPLRLKWSAKSQARGVSACGAQAT